MLMIRLARFGAKKKPSYRVVVIDKERARNSRSVEVVGFYNPVSQPQVVNLKHDRIEYWMKNGAQPSDTVTRLLKKNPRHARTSCGLTTAARSAQLNVATAVANTTTTITNCSRSEAERRTSVLGAARLRLLGGRLGSGRSVGLRGCDRDAAVELRDGPAQEREVEDREVDAHAGQLAARERSLCR